LEIEMTKQITIGSKSVTVTQLVVAIVIGALALGGGFFGMLKAEDRWNQKSNCYENALVSTELEKDMVAGFSQMIYQQNVKFEEQRLTTLYDELVRAEKDLSADPSNQAKQQRVRYLRDEINKTKSGLQTLHEKKAN